MDSFETPLCPESGTAVALGIFDGLHRAHRAVISSAVEEAARLGLEPWAFTFAMGAAPAGKTGSAFLISKDMKYRLLRGCGVAHVYAPEFGVLRGLSAEEFLDGILVSHLRARALCCGYDFRCGKNAACDTVELASLCRARGLTLRVVGEYDDGGEPVSSTRIRMAVSAGDMPLAERLAGYPFVIDTPVVRGNSIGHLHGLATINQPIAPGFVLPRFGVYASAVFTNGAFWPAVTNVGVKPTISAHESPAAETHLLGYSGDLYGERPPVFLLSFMRDEMKFQSQSGLFERIAADAAEAESLSARWIAARSAEVAKLFAFDA